MEIFNAGKLGLYRFVLYIPAKISTVFYYTSANSRALGREAKRERYVVFLDGYRLSK